MKPSMNPELVFSNKFEFRNLNKQHAEFVVTRFNESLEWLSGLEHLTTVYNKGEDISGSFTQIKTPNFGADLETILRHIILRYDTLATITMFCQGNSLDRDDQPLHPLFWYFKDFPSNGVKGNLSDAYDRGTSRYPARLSNANCSAIKGRNLSQFRKEVVGIEYKHYREWWVRGDWFSVRKETIRKKPLSYYCWLYNECQFQRGVFTEEVWFLERSWHSIFTRALDRAFKYVPKNPSVLISL
jgi:hypothetical protein